MNRWYRLLLRLYPASFRDDYERELDAAFSQLRQEANGPLAVLSLCCSTIADVVTNASVVHWEILKHDLRYAVRTLRRAPAFALTVVAVLALGIGATTAAFSITDYVLFRPLPFPDSERLVKVWEEYPGVARADVSPANYRDLKAASKSFSALGAFRGLAANLTGAGDPEYVEGSSMTADVLPLLGAVPLLGRVFTEEDDRDGAAAVVVLSYGLWQSRFAGDRGILGRTVTLDSATHTVIGVMPREFAFPTRTTALWTPMRFEAGDFDDRRNTFLHVIARLRDDTTVAQARSEMTLLAAQLATQFPADNAHTTLSVLWLRDEVSPQARQSLLLLGGAALAVLLIACANAATLLMARASSRRREVALRTAIGAGRARIVRQILTESTVLALSGALIGVALASLFLPLLSRLVPTSLPVIAQPALDARVLAFALAITAATVLIFGLAPARRVRGFSGNELLGGTRVVSGRDERFRGALVAAEICVTIVLLVGSGLLLRALWTIQSIDPGFRPDTVLTMRTALPMPRYEATDRRTRFYDSVLGDVRAIPGVSHAAYASFLPLAFRGGLWPVKVEGESEEPGVRPTASLRFITPGFFSTLRIPLLRGRDVSESDRAANPFVAVVSESFVRRHWPTQDPIGRRFHFASEERTIVGVVGDIRFRSLVRPGEPQVYLPYEQHRDGEMTWYAPKDLVIQSSLPSEALVPSIRAAVRRADPQQPLSNIRTLNDIVANETRARDVQLRVIGTFAGVAFLLAAAGIHGLLSYAVQQRLQEIGVRIALGAKRRDVIRLIGGRAALLGACGLVPGLALACVVGYAMQALLVGVSPTDVPTFAASVIVIVVMTFAGSLAPLRRALGVDPLRVIRAD